MMKEKDKKILRKLFTKKDKIVCRKCSKIKVIHKVWLLIHIGASNLYPSVYWQKPTAKEISEAHKYNQGFIQAEIIY